MAKETWARSHAPKRLRKSYCRSKSDGHKLRDTRIDMKKILLLASLFFATCFCPSLRADDQIKDASPDGKFGMLLTAEEEGGVKIQLIEVSSRKVVLDLAESGAPHAKDCNFSGRRIHNVSLSKKPFT